MQLRASISAVMYTALIISVVISVGVSFLCSLAEAALYALPLAYAKHMAEKGGNIGRAMLRLKENLGEPVAAILILNTIAHTAGASVAGAQVARIWGEEGLLIFSILYTAVVLFLSEILPKLIGVVFHKEVMALMCLPLSFCIKVLWPLVWLSLLMSNRIKVDHEKPTISEDEVRSMAVIGTAEGTLHHFEGSVISNVMSLDTTLVRDVLTPRTQVFKVEEETELLSLKSQLAEWKYSRVPIFKTDDPDHLTGYVTQRDIYENLLTSTGITKLKQISRELYVVPELITLDRLLLTMFEENEHIVAVVDEHGALAGLITLEDILEELVGKEIVDEYD